MPIYTSGSSHVAATWQGFIQEVVYLVSKGYFYYHIQKLPDKKQAKWTQIDKKIVEKYGAQRSKYQRARRKIKGLMNFFYIRHEGLVVILHTKGEPDVEIDDQFFDVRYKPLKLPISLHLILEIYMEGEKTSVRFERSMLKGLKASISDVCQTRDQAKIAAEFNKMNGVYAYRGIIMQKRRLFIFAIKEAKKHGLNPVKLRPLLHVSVKGKRYPVWESDHKNEGELLTQKP